MADTERHSHPPGPVPRLPRDEVRRRLLAAAERVFAERGYADSKLEDIARAAGFTKGAVYSNFGSKQELFGAILRERSEAELADVMAGLDAGADVAALIEQAARTVAQRIIDDTERGRLGLEIAARAIRDEETGAVVAPMRRAQRASAGRAVREVAERAGIAPPVDPELAGTILHCLTNGLAMEHLVDREGVDADTAERALRAVLGWLTEGVRK
ncbi:TetR/AcrR family transcriptional regulator [Streptomyces tubbatahanensis]|uniref:TetR/AcrR family transcriptional regulator n=1 Tax=Streptomyces tubbatahanensis TaxID=2923272 RepID=A0ABY3XWJ1_9ACTN|nr:TetR/AcrR family transcriptional regulator [Streptomyces tubbatahanensis]UNS98739.1 TetR/AcrR family transcriptional regulator [Streptomyces tubbatahanensis]